MVMHPTLLGASDPPPYTVINPNGSSACLLCCDHAGRRLPAQLGDLGVSDTDLQRHIAWDIGVAEVGRLLARQLDACLILQTYSRLVIDMNRPPGSSQSIVTLSERTPIPGNLALAPQAIAAREREIFWPYQDRIRSLVDERLAAQRPTALVSLHSFTPSFMDRSRTWHAGVLYQRDSRVAHALLALLRAEPELVVGDNEPYAANDATDYTVLVHGERRGLPHVELEIRQDLIDSAPGQEAWAARLAALLPRALEPFL